MWQRLKLGTLRHNSKENRRKDDTTSKIKSTAGLGGVPDHKMKMKNFAFLRLVTGVVRGERPDMRNSPKLTHWPSHAMSRVTSHCS